MTWDDEKPFGRIDRFPPAPAWWGAAPPTAEDDLVRLRSVGKSRYITDNEMPDARIMNALTRLARKGISPAARPTAMALGH